MIIPVLSIHPPKLSWISKEYIIRNWGSGLMPISCNLEYIYGICFVAEGKIFLYEIEL